MESKFEEFKDFIKKLALYYGKNFNLPWEDLYQEGCLAFITTYKKYRHLKEEELNLVLKEVINRWIYKVVQLEVDKRKREVEMEVIHEED